MGEVLQLVVPSKTVTENYGERTVTYTWDQKRQHWKIVIQYTEQREMHRHADTLENARKIVIKSLALLDTAASS